MTARHTPGPWTKEASPHPGSSGFWSCRVEGADGFTLAMVFGKPSDEAEANARLVAAAPDLLTALEQMLAAFPAPKISAPGGFAGNLAHAQARTALAKAGAR